MMSFYADGDAFSAFDLMPPIEFRGGTGWRDNWVDFFAPSPAAAPGVRRSGSTQQRPARRRPGVRAAGRDHERPGHRHVGPYDELLPPHRRPVADGPRPRVDAVDFATGRTLMNLTPREAERMSTSMNKTTDAALDQIADGFSQQTRSPVLHSPAEEAWTTRTSLPLRRRGAAGRLVHPAPARPVIIANHPMGFTRAGCPPTCSRGVGVGGAAATGSRSNLIPDYKILHDAGYNVLAYDLRNIGLSGAANGGVVSSGLFEARDVVGSLRYASSGEDTGTWRRACSAAASAQLHVAAMTPVPRRLRRASAAGRAAAGTTEVIMGRLLDLLGSATTSRRARRSASAAAPASASAPPATPGMGRTSAYRRSSTRSATTC